MLAFSLLLPSKSWLSARTQLSLLAIFLAADGCKPPQESGEPGAYIENGQLWAYGSVQLANLDAPGAVMIKRSAAGQTLDNQGNTTAKYSMYGAVMATTTPGATSGSRDIAYVDFHPTADKLLAFAYTTDFEARDGNPDMIDVFAILRKGGRSYYNRQKVWLGTANFQKGSLLTSMDMADGLKLSLIADGVYSGMWSLHYPDVQTIVVRPWQGLCPKDVMQMPGQNPSQNPGQFDSCRPLPAQDDLCNGDPTQDSCRPTPWVVQQAQIPMTPAPISPTPANPAPVNPAPVSPAPVSPQPVKEPGKVVSGLTEISTDTGVYQMEEDKQEARIIFSSATMKSAGDSADAVTCSKQFYAVARTVGRQVNTACVLKPAPATSQNGMLTCGMTVSFDQPQTYLERVCEIAATFRGDKDETQHIQVLKK